MKAVEDRFHLSQLKGAMYSYANDLTLCVQIGYFNGPTNEDADFERYLQGMLDIDERCAGRDSAIILVVEPGNPPPHSAWRKRIADGTAVLQSFPKFALVSNSLLIRGVMTAINWVRPPVYESIALGTFDEAVDWMLARRKLRRERLYELLAQAKAGRLA